MIVAKVVFLSRCRQFAARAEAAGLAYLGEADISAMWTGHLTPDVSETLNRVASDLVQMEGNRSQVGVVIYGLGAEGN